MIEGMRRSGLRTNGDSAKKSGPQQCYQHRAALTNRAMERPMAKPIPTDISDDVKASFWAKVDVREPKECWRWLGRKNSVNYGRFRIAEELFSSTRLALIFTTGVDGGELMALHSCDNPICVNPAHLRWGTARDNAKDAIERNRFHKWNGARSGQLNPYAKLTEADVRQVRQMVQNGQTQLAVAKAFGVSQPVVSNIVAFKAWANLKEISCQMK